MEPLSEEELDMVTAQGRTSESEIEGNAGDDGSSSSPVADHGHAAIMTVGGQESLRGMVVNNIVGENQVANGINLR